MRRAQRAVPERELAPVPRTWCDFFPLFSSTISFSGTPLIINIFFFSDAEKKDEKKETRLSNSNHSHYRSPLTQAQKIAREPFTYIYGTKSSGSWRAIALKRDVLLSLALTIQNGDPFIIDVQFTNLTELLQIPIAVTFNTAISNGQD